MKRRGGANVGAKIALVVATEKQPAQRSDGEKTLQRRGEIARVACVRYALTQRGRAFVRRRGVRDDRSEHGLRVGVVRLAAGVAMEGEMGVSTGKTAVIDALAATTAQQSVLSAHHAGHLGGEGTALEVLELIGNRWNRGSAGWGNGDRNMRTAAGRDDIFVE